MHGPHLKKDVVSLPKNATHLFWYLALRMLITKASLTKNKLTKLGGCLVALSGVLGNQRYSRMDDVTLRCISFHFEYRGREAWVIIQLESKYLSFV